jgi:hypothetical protein
VRVETEIDIHEEIAMRLKHWLTVLGATVFRCRPSMTKDTVRCARGGSICRPEALTETAMTPFSYRRPTLLHQRGQSMIEYTIICAVLVVCLFAFDTPVGKALTDAIRNFYLDLTLFISLP